MSGSEPTQKKFHLSADDPAPVSMREGKSAVIFAGPHNGHAVPKCLQPCLGTDESWFETAHEASDLHVSGLFDALMETRPEDSYIWGNYSRLVCDLNCKPDYAITQSSSEYSHIMIPQNMPDQCCEGQTAQRLATIYEPYHTAQAEILDEVRSNNGGQAILLEVHSFNPTWEQKRRDVEIGTIRCEKTPLSRALENFLSEQDDYQFVSGEPYRVADRPGNAAPIITEQNDIQFLGLEIRHDLIATPEGKAKMADFLARCAEHLENSPGFHVFAQPRSSAIAIDNENRMSHLGF